MIPCQCLSQFHVGVAVAAMTKRRRVCLWRALSLPCRSRPSAEAQAAGHVHPTELYQYHPFRGSDPTQSDQMFLSRLINDDEPNVPIFLSLSKRDHWRPGDRGIADGRESDELARSSYRRRGQHCELDDVQRPVKGRPARDYRRSFRSDDRKSLTVKHARVSASVVVQPFEHRLCGLRESPCDTM